MHNSKSIYSTVSVAVELTEIKVLTVENLHRFFPCFSSLASIPAVVDCGFSCILIVFVSDCIFLCLTDMHPVGDMSIQNK